MAEPAAPPSHAKTVQWSPNGPVVNGTHRSPAASIGACDACRAKKACVNCSGQRKSANRVISKTRRRKRTDTRVKELEEKVRNLSVLLEKGRNSSTQRTTGTSKEGPIYPDEGMDDEYEDATDDDHGGHECQDYDGKAVVNGQSVCGGRAKAAQFSTSKGCPQPAENTDTRPSFNVAGYIDGNSEDSSGVLPDIVDRGVLTMKEATELFDRYVKVLSPNYPATVFPSGASASEIRSKRPILFLAVIAAAAGTARPALNLRLNQEILQVYATKVALQGQKNLDLVQSILVSSLWYYPPERFDQLKFHQYIHMAATMALDLGLGKRPRTRILQNHTKSPLTEHFEPQRVLDSEVTMATPARPPPDSSSIECRRTLLTCYLQCANVSMSLRLPNALRFTSYMGECLHVLEVSPEAAPTDGRFAAWVRIQRIVEECVNSFSLDDLESTVSLAENRVQPLLRGYEKQMEEWHKTLKPGILNSFLEINFHVNNIYVHEISLHPDHEPEDFRPPFYVATLPISKIPASTNPAYVNAIMECVSSAQTVLSTFMDMDISTIQGLPALVFVRIVYSSVVLIKVEISCRASGSELGKILDCEKLNLPSHLQEVLAHQALVVGAEGKNILAAKFLMIMKRLISWYHNYKAQLASCSKVREGLEPGKIAELENRVAEVSETHNQTKFAQSIPTQNTLPDFSKLPANSFQPLSGIEPDPLPPPPNQPLNGFISAADVDATNIAPEQQIQQILFDSQQAMLAVKPSSPSADYSSPESYPPGNSGDQKGWGNGMSPPVAESKMEVDPNMFGQLQEIGEPFTYNPNPNDWLFDGNMTGIDDISEFEWGPAGI